MSVMGGAGTSLDSKSSLGGGPTAHGRLAMVAAVLGSVAVVVYLAAVRTAWGQRVDEAMKAWWLPERRGWEGEARVIARLFAAPLLLAATLGTGIVLVARRRVDAVWAIAALLLVGPGLAWALKHELLTREVLVGGTFPPSNTLPSGHGAAVAMTALIAVWLAPLRLRGIAVVVAASFAALAGIVLVVAALHRPSDIVASSLLMGVWTAGVLALGGRDEPALLPGSRAVVSVAVIAGTLLLFGGTLAGRAILASRDADTAELYELAASCLLVAGTAMAVVASLGWAMSRVGVPARCQGLRSKTRTSTSPLNSR